MVDLMDIRTVRIINKYSTEINNLIFDRNQNYDNDIDSTIEALVVRILEEYDRLPKK